MFKKVLIAAAGLATVLVWVVSAQSDLKAVVDKSMKAMGVENVKTLTISGEGGDGAVGQTYNPFSDKWRWTANKNWTRSVDFDAKGWRDVRDRSEGEPANQCGGAGTTCPAPSQNGAVAVASANNFNNQVQFSMLPLGFLKMALEKNATVSKEKKFTVLTFPMENGTAYKTTVKGYINDQGMVEKVGTMIDQGMLGDVNWEVTFSGYKDFGGVKFPTSIVQRQGGPKIWEMTVADVKINQPVDLTPPAGRGGKGAPGGGAAKGGAPKGGDGKGGDGKGAPPEFAGGGDGKGKGGPGGGPVGGGRGAPAAIESEDLGGGFWLVTGGYGAVVANFKDYIIVIEGPSNDMRADQIIAEAKRLVPGKQIKYVINTHAHFDHSQGLRDFVAEGATIITNQGNKGYYEKVLAVPHTLVPDNLQKKNPKAKIKVEYVGDKKVLTDGTHTIELHKVMNSTHNNAMLIAYLPAQKIVVEADEYNVLGNPAPTTPAANPNQYQINLLANIERLKLDVDRIIPIHLPTPATRKVTLTELKLAAGKS